MMKKQLIDRAVHQQRGMSQHKWAYLGQFFLHWLEHHRYNHKKSRPDLVDGQVK